MDDAWVAPPIDVLDKLVEDTIKVLAPLPRVVAVSVPALVVGDLHGDARDLAALEDTLWPRGVDTLPGGGVVFLGDYVDRGAGDLAVVTRLFTLLCAHPDRVTLLRGNHERAATNGDTGTYGRSCLLSRCQQAYGTTTGTHAWTRINEAFNWLPLAAVVGSCVACVHGGVPPSAISFRDYNNRALDALSCVCKPWTGSLKAVAPRHVVQAVLYALWGDADDGAVLRVRERGFGFADADLTAFLAAHGLTTVVRGHQLLQNGVHCSFADKLVTVHSSRQNHGGTTAVKCGYITVTEDGTVQAHTV